MRILIAALALAPFAAHAEDKSAIYAKDVAFFLDEFEDKAGHFFEQKGIDWDGVRTWAKGELAEVKTDNDHLKLCTRLVARLQDGHARLRGARVEWPDESEGRKWRFQKIGMILQDEKALVTLVDPSLEIPIGSEITAIDGEPALEWIGAKADEWADRRGYSTRWHAMASAAAMGLSGWEGTTFKVAFTRPDGTKGEREVDRSLGEHSPVRLDTSKQLSKLTPFDRRSRFGRTKKGNAYIQLAHVPGDLPEQLEKILPQLADAPGLVLDMRGNSGGGCDHYAVFVQFLKKGEFWGKLEGKGPFSGPMVVIIDSRVASSGETLAGQFGEDQRALVIGPSATAGMSSQKVTIEAPSKLCSAYFSIRSNKGRFNRGRGIEGIGVLPHITTPYTQEDLAADIDTQIKVAEELLEERKWPEHIDYEPPGS